MDRSMRLSIAILIVFISMTNVVRAQDRVNVWRGLIPLHSTRVDVEKIFGAPKKTYRDAFYESAYEAAEENIRVEYSEGRCHENQYSIWNVLKKPLFGSQFRPKVKLAFPNSESFSRRVL